MRRPGKYQTMNDALTLRTSRLRLVPATPALVDLELAGEERLAEELEADPAADWPPEHHDAETLRFTLKRSKIEMQPDGGCTTSC